MSLVQVVQGIRLEEACQDGTLLVKLVQSLEGRALSGITWNPVSRAAMLFNIRKVLEVLRTRVSMPLDLLWSEDDILHGALIKLPTSTCYI